MAGDSPGQRMRSERTKVALSAAVGGKAKANTQHVRLVNLSATGCLMETDEPLREGEVVRLRFSLPGQTEVEVLGTVARVAQEGSGQQIGISFSELDEQKSEHLARHVATQKRGRKGAPKA